MVYYTIPNGVTLLYIITWLPISLGFIFGGEKNEKIIKQKLFTKDVQPLVEHMEQFNDTSWFKKCGKQ